MKAHINKAVDWLRDQDLLLLVGALFLILGAWVFLELADMVKWGETQRVDEKIILALRNPEDPSDPIGPEWLEEIGRDLTALGGIVVLLLLTASVVGYLVLVRMYHAVGLVAAATLGGLVMSNFLKFHYHRPRPDLVPHLSKVMTSSFPSGHSMMSAVVYLTLGALLARLVRPVRLKIYFISLALLLTGLVGASRVYMGVHWPTDVLAGWSAGGAWAVLCWLAARHLQRRGAVEKEMDGDDHSGEP